MTRDVVVTGLGPLCSSGGDAPSLWASLLAARSGITSVPWLADSAVSIGSYVADESLVVRDARERRLDRVTRLALIAARRALAGADLLGDDGRFVGASDRVGVILGTSRGAAGTLERAYERFVGDGGHRVSPHASPLSTTGGLSGAVARHLGLRGPNLTVAAACSSASQAIGMAFDAIRLGRADVMLAGGAEACLTPFCVAMFDAAGILSHRLDDPARACRPFDRHRDGTVVGEGAGILVLETARHARRRDATIHAGLCGFGVSCDAHSLTGIPEDGDGLVRAASAALADADIKVADLGGVGAHGTGTRLGDRAESVAYRRLLGPDLGRVPVAAVKASTGHLLGAAGGIEAIVGVLAVERGSLPPSANLDDPEFDLDVVVGAPRPLARPWMLTSSMGFGGNNACLVFGPRP